MKNKNKKYVVLKFLLLVAAILTLSACGFLFDTEEPPVNQNDVNESNEVIEEVPTLSPEESAGYGDFEYQPVFDFKGTGNFTDIDESIWQESSLNPRDYVGKWYEDGLTNGYYLEIYGDGTWQFFGEDIVKGYYYVWANDIINFMEGRYDVIMGQANHYNSEDGRLVLSLSPYTDMVKTRGVYPIEFFRTKDSHPCDDLDAYYAENYRFRDWEGKWYLVGGSSVMNFFEILGSGNWGEEKNGQGMLEVGLLEDCVDGKYISEGANSGEEYVFEYPGDGYLYINGEQYERREGVDVRYEYIVDRWFFYDEDNGCYTDTGYEFFEDLTFESLPANSEYERGTYLFVDDNLLLYDDDGRQIHHFYQDIFSARKKTISVGDNEGYMKGEKQAPIWDAP